MEIWGKVRAAACVAACAALLSGTAAAQETINFGSVSGRIADEQGVPGKSKPQVLDDNRLQNPKPIDPGHTA